MLDDENIKEVVIRYDDTIHSIVFKTTRDKVHSIGYGGDKEYKFYMKNKVVIGFYGGFEREYLVYLGVYYACVRDLTQILLPYFKLKKLIKKNYEDGLEVKFKILEPYAAFSKLCCMPNIIFINVLKYI